jgi:hypothetical protein
LQGVPFSAAGAGFAMALSERGKRDLPPRRLILLKITRENCSPGLAMSLKEPQLVKWYTSGNLIGPLLIAIQGWKMARRWRSCSCLGHSAKLRHTKTPLILTS